MNTEQCEFINQPNTNGVLIGIPGGGKSTSIINRILHQVETCQIPRDGGFIVVTFSRAAAEDFQRKGREKDPDLFLPKYIRTIHSLAGVLTSKTGSKSSSISTVVYRATKEIRLNPNAVQAYKNVKVIYVDEAQDISRTQYELVCTLGEVLSAAVVLVGDEDQALYAFQGGSSEFLLNHGGFRIELVQNYRSTDYIVDLANRARPTKSATDMMSASGKQGVKPTIISNTHAALAGRLIQIIQESMSKNKLVAVIGPSKKSGYRDYQGNMNNVGLQWAYHILARHKIPARIHYNEGLHESAVSSNSKTENVSLTKTHVHLFTIHGSKGLEFDTVIFLNFHRELMGFRHVTSRDHESYKCMVYVGLTRAKEELWVFHARHRDVWQDYHSYRDCMRLEGEVIDIPKFELSPEIIPSRYGWTDVLNNRKILSEDRLSELEDMASINVATSGDTFPPAQTHLPDEDKISIVYGLWSENMFENRYRGLKPKCYRQIKHMMEHMEVIQNPCNMSIISKIYRNIGLTPDELLTFSDYEYYKEQNTVAPDIDDLITSALHRHDGMVFFHHPGITRFFDTKELQELLIECDQYRDIPSAHIFRMALFLFQYQNECKYRWYYKYDAHIKALEHFEQYISRTAALLPEGYEFDVECRLDMKKQLRGYADAVHYGNGEMLELKFTTSFTMTQGLQALGYAIMCYPIRKVKVLNLRTHKVYDISSPLLSPEGIQTFTEYLDTNLV
jgi:hypothetical protein